MKTALNVLTILVSLVFAPFPDFPLPMPGKRKP